MAKTSKNKKQSASENSNLVKSSSNQKENRPKKVNVNRNLNENIGMSKQLMMKKSAQNSRTKRKPASAMRVLPSLTDLEKMFEDSDEDMDDIDSAGPSCLNLSNSNHNTAPTNLPQEPSNTLQVHANTEPMTHNEPSHSLHDVQLLSPPRKRVKLHTEYNEIDDLPPVMISPSKQCTVNSASILESNLATSASQSKTISEAFSPKPSTSKDIKTIRSNDELFSRSIQLKNSNDRNETEEQTITQMVESFTPPVIIGNDVIGEPPISTVQTNETPVKSSTSFVIINDSVREEPSMDTVQTNETQNLTQTVESSTPSIIIDDSVIVETPIDIVAKIDNDIEIIDSLIQFNSTNTRNIGDRTDNSDDDDCVFVETRPNTTKAVPEETEVIDLEYSFIDDETLSRNIERMKDEVIDVDAIIALNRSIIDKYCTPSLQNSRCSSNLVVDVEMNTTIEDNTSNRNIQNQNENQSINNAAPNSLENVQSQPTSNQSANPSSRTGRERELLEDSRDLEIRTGIMNRLITSMNQTREGRANRQLENVQSQPTSNQSANPSSRTNRERELLEDSRGLEIRTGIMNSLITSMNQTREGRANRRLENVQSQPTSNQSANPSSRTGRERELLEDSRSLERRTGIINSLITSMNQTGEGRANRRQQLNRAIAGFFNPSQTNDSDQNEYQSPFSSYYYPLLEMIGIRSINVPDRTSPYPQTSPSYPSTQAMTSGQRIQLTTSNSQKTPVTPNTSVPTSNDVPPKSSEKDQLGDCPICMDRLSNKQMASTICGHIFCYTCIETAIKSNRRCPSCRRVLNKIHGFHKIFL